MVTQRNDGGPAYPANESHGMNNGMPGMSLRDAMALSVHMPDEYAMSGAEALLGEKAPQANGIEAAPIDQYIDFWLRAEAAYRYRLADAMLAARERT